MMNGPRVLYRLVIPALFAALSAALFAVLLLLVACRQAEPAVAPAGAPAGAGPPASHQELARHYAPVIKQGAANDQDYITAADFDGDWIGNNNWQNQPAGDLSAHVYYSVIETETHWFLFYSIFHPRDYTSKPCEDSGGCHENDLESIQLVVLKDSTKAGKLLVVETLAHSEIYLYPVDPSVLPNALPAAGRIRFEESHPIVYIETYGHGIYGTRRILFPGVITYRVGDVAETPEGIKDEDTSYLLVSIVETLWTHRDDIGAGRAFDQPFDYRGRVLAAALDGDDFGEDRANSPWGYNQATGDVLSRGDWFLDPARALAYHASFEGEYSLEYVYNPYLVDLGLMDDPVRP